MIDYDATLQSFFAECVKFLENRRSKVQDQADKDKINIAINVVRRVAGNPVKYADYSVRVSNGLENCDVGYAFGLYSMGVFSMYKNVLHHMGELNSRFYYRQALARQTLLNALKSIKYKNDKNILKDFYFPFMSPNKFAVKIQQKQR